MSNHPNRSRRKDAPAVPNNIGAWLRDRERGKVPTPEHIRNTRRFAGATLDEMAELLHVSKRTYQDWESGRTEMHPNHWLAMRCACVALAAERDAEAREVRAEREAG